jgi:hypothetical protein
MRKGCIVDLLARVDYPTDPLAAAVEWKISIDHARKRLLSGRRHGFLFSVGKQYSPTPELLQAWLAAGVLI